MSPPYLYGEFGSGVDAWYRLTYMGYELHITRKKNWSDEDGLIISFAEWGQCVEQDSELSFSLDVEDDDRGKVVSYRGHESAFLWRDGEISSKNPEPTLIVKMVAIAAALDAHVQGDDGEIYLSDGTARAEQQNVRTSTPGLLQRIKDWFAARSNARQWQSGVPAFRVGSRVRDFQGRLGRVTKVDRHAEHGAGHLSVRFDDGRESCYALIAPGVELDGLGI